MTNPRSPRFNTKTVIQFRLQALTLDMIKDIADSKGLKYQDFMRMVLTEAVRLARPDVNLTL